MRYLSICSGIEAASVAWNALGWEPVGFSEIEAFPSAVLARHWPQVPNLGDLTKYHDWPASLRPDLIVGGTPCQAFSVAGLRKGLADPRGNLTLVFLGLLAHYRPRWVVWENVPGVLSDRSGAFGAFLGGLGELGYGFAYRVLDAQYFGVAQRRRRVFVVGHLGDWRRAAAVLFEPESLRGDSPPRREAGEGAAYELAPCVAASGRGFERAGDTRGADCVIPVGVPEVANPLTARMHKGINTTCDEGQTMIAHALLGEGFDASEDGTGRGTPLVPVPAIAFESRIGRNGRGYGVECVNALNGADAGATSDMRPCVAMSGRAAVRRLTPRECERLQGFPDDHTLIEYRGKPAADGPRYKALGNSMAVPVMRWIGEGIAAIDALPAAANEERRAA